MIIMTTMMMLMLIMSMIHGVPDVSDMFTLTAAASGAFARGAQSANVNTVH
jgi:hypothetical protein